MKIFYYQEKHNRTSLVLLLTSKWQHCPKSSLSLATIKHTKLFTQHFCATMETKSQTGEHQHPQLLTHLRSSCKIRMPLRYRMNTWINNYHNGMQQYPGNYFPTHTDVRSNTLEHWGDFCPREKHCLNPKFCRRINHTQKGHKRIFATTKSLLYI